MALNCEFYCIPFRESHSEVDFESALDFCIAKDYSNGPGNNTVKMRPLYYGMFNVSLSTLSC